MRDSVALGWFDLVKYRRLKGWIFLAWLGLVFLPLNSSFNFAQDYDDSGYYDDSSYYDESYDDAPWETQDSDGDGLDDDLENYGYEVAVDYEETYLINTYDEEGNMVYEEVTKTFSYMEWVTTDPNNPDSDGDLVEDGAEFIL